MKKPITLPRGKTAALFVDLQEEHRKDPRYLVEGYDKVIANVQRLQAAARDNAVPVLHCAYIVDLDAPERRKLHPVLADGTSAFSDKSDPLTAVCPEVEPVGDEFLHIKAQASGLRDGVMRSRLAALGAEWVVIAGVWTEACVDATVRDAVDLGLHVLLVKDACGSGTSAMHEAAIINLANRLYGGAVVDTATACRLLAGETADAWQIEGAVPLRFTFESAAEVYRGL